MFDLTDDELKELVNQLVTYAHIRMKLYPKHNSEVIICGKTPTDIAYEAINKYLIGERIWDPDKVPDLSYFLRQIIDSLVSHFYESKEFTSRGTLQIVNEDEDDQILFDHEFSKDPTPEEQLESDELKEQLIEKVKHDEDMLLVLLSMFDRNTAIEISDDFGIPISEVRNIIKRIRRSIL